MNVDKLSTDAAERHTHVVKLMSTIETKFVEWAREVLGSDYEMVYCGDRTYTCTAAVYGGYVRDHIRHVQFGDDLRVADVDIGIWIHDQNGRHARAYGRRDWDKIVREFLVPFLQTNGYDSVECSQRANVRKSQQDGYYCYTLKLTYPRANGTGTSTLSVDLVPRWLGVSAFDDFRCNRLCFGVDHVLRVDAPYMSKFTVENAIDDIRDKRLVELTGRDHEDLEILRDARIAKMTALGYTLV